MGPRLLLLVALACFSVLQVRADYMNITGWGDNVSGLTCEQMMAGSYTRLVNRLIESDWATCQTASAGVYAQFECLSNGTARVQFSQYDDCSHDEGAPDYILPTKPTIWGAAACWSGTQLPPIGILTYLRVVCYAGTIPAPGAPPPPQTNPPVIPPVIPPVQPPVQSPIAPVQPPVASPIGTPVSAPVTPPVAIPVAPPEVDLPLASKNAWFTVYTGSNCGGGVYATTNVSTDFETCQDFNGYKFWTGCTDKGAPYGTVCTVCTTPDDASCTPWPYLPATTVMWDTPRCVSTSTPSISMTCSPVYEQTAPNPPPVQFIPITPPPPEAPAVPAPVAPVAPIAPVPLSRTPSLDYSLHSGSCTGATITTGSFDESPSCQTLFNPVIYGVGQCSDSGSPSGKFCTSSGCTTGCTLIPSNTAGWGESVCVVSSGRAVKFACNNHTEPPPPQAEPTPEPPPISSGGQINFIAYNDVNCKFSILPLKLKADISLCQSAAPTGTTSTIYLKVDCYYNNTIHGALCGSDSTCTTCTPLPQAPSDICVPYSMQQGLVSAIKATCPAFPPGLLPSPPSDAVPTGSATSLNFLSSLLILSLLLILWV
jgi:hypothetical protein